MLPKISSTACQQSETERCGSLHPAILQPAFYMLHEVDNAASPRMESMVIYEKMVYLPVTVLVLLHCGSIVNGGIDVVLVSCVRQYRMGHLVVLTYLHFERIENNHTCDQLHWLRKVDLLNWHWIDGREFRAPLTWEGLLDSLTCLRLCVEIHGNIWFLLDVECRVHSTLVVSERVVAIQMIVGVPFLQGNVSSHMD